MDMGPCPKVHSLQLRKEYEEAKAKGVDSYDRDLEDVIDRLIVECDRKITRALKRLADEDAKAAIAISVTEVTQTEEIAELSKQIKEKLQQVDRFATDYMPLKATTGDFSEFFPESDKTCSITSNCRDSYGRHFIQEFECLQDVRNPPDCDFFDGDWFYDPAGPVHTNNTCPVITQMQICQGNGSPDKEYESWRWKPSLCELPRFNGTNFLELMSGKTLAFVGPLMR